MRHDAPLKISRRCRQRKRPTKTRLWHRNRRISNRLCPRRDIFFHGRRMLFALAGVLILGEIPPVTTWETNREQADASLL
jgi:hypothetical protein